MSDMYLYLDELNSGFSHTVKSAVIVNVYK